MTAVGRHYGSQVGLWAIWNEPNHPAFLQPQFNSNGQPASPRIYRALFQAGYNGLKAAGHRQPEGADGRNRAHRLRYGHRAAKGPLHDVAPLAFLRGALCLNAHYRKSGSLRVAAGVRLRPPRLHASPPAPPTSRREPTT